MAKYVIKTKNGSYLAANGNFYKPQFLGPGALKYKFYRSITAALKYAKRIPGATVEVA